MKNKFNNTNQNKLEHIVDAKDREKGGEWLIRLLSGTNIKRSDLDDESCDDKLDLGDEPAVTVQLKYLFESLDINRQQKFNNFIISAVYQWTPEAYGASIIQDLAFLSAYTRATRIIGHLTKFLREGWLINLGEKYEETFAIIIAVLSGFTPSDDVQILFKDLWRKQDLDPRYAAQIFIGLCKCDPKKYYKYISRFWDFHQKHPELYQMRFVISEFARIVPLSLRSDTFKDLDLSSQMILKKLFDNFSKESVVEETTDLFDIYQAMEQMEDIRSRLRKIINESFVKENKLIDNNNEVIQTILQAVCSISKSQMAAVFLFGKSGNLYLNGLQGTDSKGNPIQQQDWFSKEVFTVFNNEEVNTNNFIARAAIPASNGFGRITHLLSEEDLPIESKKRYFSLLGSLNCATAVPLNGAHKTFGVLVIVNKVNPETLQPIINCVFSKLESEWLSKSIGPFVARRISDLRKNKQKNIITFLEELLQKSSAEDPRDMETVCQSIVDRLVSDNTAFNVCILRRKDEDRLTVLAQSPQNEPRLVNWEGRKNEPIKKEEKAIDDSEDVKTIMRNTEPEFLKITSDNLHKFAPNEDWVKSNDFKSFARFPLIARGQVVGTLSLYVSYDYQFHSSCKKFLSTITTLMALFMVEKQEEAAIQQYLTEELEKRTVLVGRIIKIRGLEESVERDKTVAPSSSMSTERFLGAEGNTSISTAA